MHSGRMHGFFHIEKYALIRMGMSIIIRFFGRKTHQKYNGGWLLSLNNHSFGYLTDLWYNTYISEDFQ